MPLSALFYICNSSIYFNLWIYLNRYFFLDTLSYAFTIDKYYFIFFYYTICTYTSNTSLSLTSNFVVYRVPPLFACGAVLVYLQLHTILILFWRAGSICKSRFSGGAISLSKFLLFGPHDWTASISKIDSGIQFRNIFRFLLIDETIEY